MEDSSASLTESAAVIAKSGMRGRLPGIWKTGGINDRNRTT